MANKVHAAGIIFENRHGQILVLKRHPGRPEGQTWGLVGGKVENGEEPKAAAVREAQEETGHNIDSKKLLFFKKYHWNRDGLELTFDVFKLVKRTDDDLDLRIDANEHTEHKWETPQNLYSRKDLMAGLYPILRDLYKVK